MEDDTLSGLEEGEVMSEINVTPFIDIMLVLLIIFMVTAPLMLGGIQVNLPRASLDPVARPQNPVIISIDALNRVFVDREEISGEDRHGVFQELARQSASGEAYVRGDGEVKYARIVEVMAELGQAGFARVILVADTNAPVSEDTGTPVFEGAPPPQAPPAGE